MITDDVKNSDVHMLKLTTKVDEEFAFFVIAHFRPYLARILDLKLGQIQ